MKEAKRPIDIKKTVAANAETAISNPFTNYYLYPLSFWDEIVAGWSVLACLIYWSAPIEATGAKFKQSGQNVPKRVSA